MTNLAQIIKHVSIGLLVAGAVTGCEFFSANGGEENNGLEPTAIFVLCEGNFGSNNASLWQISTELESTVGNVFQALTGLPLGDTGQSLTVDGDRLYIVVNGSGTVEVIERTASALQYVGRIDLAGAGPREMAVHDSTGYVTCWYLNAVLTINLTTLAVTDTILLPGMPEDILVFDEVLYVAVPLQTGWSTYDQVITVDPVTVGPTATYSVGNGPQQLAVFNGEIYVSRQWYDENYTSYRGIARIDPGQGQVEKADWGTGGGVDIFLANGTLYLATGSGVQALKPDLSLDEASAIGSEVAHQYAAGSDGERIFITASDFVNPGQIHVFTTGDQLLAQFTVGTNPGAFAFFRE